MAYLNILYIIIVFVYVLRVTYLCVFVLDEILWIILHMSVLSWANLNEPHISVSFVQWSHMRRITIKIGTPTNQQRIRITNGTCAISNILVWLVCTQVGSKHKE